MRCGFGRKRVLPRTMLIDSVPPATICSAMPAMIRSAAMAMVCEPEEQKRLTVTAGTLSGSPARGDARDVHARLPLRRGAAEDDVVHVLRLELRRLREQRADDVRGHVVRTRGAQRAARRFPDGGAERGNDYGFIHRFLVFANGKLKIEN